MAFTNGPIFTNAGKELHSRAIAGDALKFTKMQMGDGSLDGRAIDSLTALIHPVASVEIATLKHSGNFATVGGVFNNATLTSGFYWREVGLFAADPDAPDDRTKDILYCYQNAGSLAEFIPASANELISKRINIVVIADETATVSATVAEATRAADISFDNSETDLEATDAQSAIVELTMRIADYAARPAIAIGPEEPEGYDVWIDTDEEDNIPQIATGSYIGTGTYGENNPNSLTFPFEPKVVFIQRSAAGQDGGYAWVRNASSDKSCNYNSDYHPATCSLTWSGNTLSWYYSVNAGYQLNTSGTTYHYVAIG